MSNPLEPHSNEHAQPRQAESGGRGKRTLRPVVLSVAELEEQAETAPNVCPSTILRAIRLHARCMAEHPRACVRVSMAFVPDDSIGTASQRLQRLVLRIDRELAGIHHERMVAGQPMRIQEAQHKRAAAAVTSNQHGGRQIQPSSASSVPSVDARASADGPHAACCWSFVSSLLSRQFAV